MHGRLTGQKKGRGTSSCQPVPSRHVSLRWTISTSIAKHGPSLAPRPGHNVSLILNHKRDRRIHFQSHLFRNYTILFHLEPEDLQRNRPSSARSDQTSKVSRWTSSAAKTFGSWAASQNGKSNTTTPHMGQSTNSRSHHVNRIHSRRDSSGIDSLRSQTYSARHTTDTHVLRIHTLS